MRPAQGVITHRNRTFQKSYPMLLDLVQHMFPPITDKSALESQEAANQFNSFDYWRKPIAAYEESDDDNDDARSELADDTPYGM